MKTARMSKFTQSLFVANIPENWRLVPVGAVLAETEYGLSEPSDSAGNVRVVGMKDLVDGYVNTDDLGTIDGGESGWLHMQLRAGDLLLNRTNSADLVGKVGIVKEDSDAVFASYLVRLKTKNEKVEPSYLNFWLNSEIAQRALKRLSTRGVSQSNINPTEFKKHCPVPLPPLPEQRKIAEILQAWDEAFEKTARLIAAKEWRFAQLARSFFLPCHPKSERRENDWREFELGAVFKERVEGGRAEDRLLSITMSEGVIDRDEVGRKDTSNDDKSKYKLILPGDIGYNTMRMWQGVSGLSSLRGIVSPAYTIVTPDNINIDAHYAAHLFKSRRMVFEFERYSQGLTSDTWNLKFPAFSDIKVFLPPIEKQRKQAALLNAMRDEIAVMRNQKESISRQRRGLMQKLLTGEWRVGENAEEEAVV